MTARIVLAASVTAILVAGGIQAAARSQDDAAAAQATITGTVAYRERIALPPDAIVQVRLDDVSQPEGAPKRVAETTVPTAGKQVPIPFELSYKPADIVPNRRYVVRAKITAGDKILFSTKTPYPVITRGAPTSLEILVQQGGGGRPGRTKPAAATGGAGLVGVQWKLVAIGGAPALERPDGQQAHVSFNTEKKSFSGSTGCNRLVGTLDLAGGLRLAAGGMTMMACPEDVMEQEQAFLEALKATSGYRAADGSLDLLDGDGRVLARFVSVPADPAPRSH
jgi:putative lipoprotein